jgi:Flp pilus assembly pilin Flp
VGLTSRGDAPCAVPGPRGAVERTGRSVSCPAGKPRSFEAGARSAGQGVVEYGLILSLSAALAVILLVFFGGTLSLVLQAVGDAIDAAS